MAAQVEQNPRGIPKAPFVENVKDFLESDSAVEGLLRKFNETLWTFKRMELGVQQRKRNLDIKIPELEKALQTTQLLKFKADDDEGESIESHFELCETLYAKAKLKSVEKVCIWLGANVMIEYSIDEALELLTDKLAHAKQSLQVVHEDLDYLREQITTMEVNIARVYNWDVKQRRSMVPSSSSS